MEITSKKGAAKAFNAWKDPEAKWETKLTLSILLEPNEDESMLDVTSPMLKDKFRDGTIVTDCGDEIKCHRSILTANSEEFEKMLKASMESSEIGVLRLPGISGATGRALVHYLFTRRIYIPKGDFGVYLELLEAGKMYKVNNLQKRMEEFICEKMGRGCSVDIAFKVFLHAIDGDSEQLKVKAMQILKK